MVNKNALKSESVFIYFLVPVSAAAVATVGEARCLLGLSALGAPCGLVGKAFLIVESLLAFGEYEFRAAVLAY